MIRRLAGAASVLILGLALSRGEAAAQGAVLPWGQSSDMIGWQTLAQLMAPAGNPATHTVEFETWASDEDIYLTSPPVWPTVNTATPAKRLQPAALGLGPHALALTGSQCLHPTDPSAAGFLRLGCVGEEVRRNWASFQYIVSNGLYSTDGLARAFKNRLRVDFPADAVEFKGDWVRVSDLITWIRRTEGVTLDAAAVRQNYYVQPANDGTKTTEYALVSFHFSTKQIKNWVWADFEHKWNPGRCDTTGCHDSFGATETDVRPRQKINQNYGDCAKTPKLLSILKNADIDLVWQNYCLKGTEVTFMQPDGQVSILGDSVIERMDAGIPVAGSSCITCHGYASYDRNGKRGLFAVVETIHPIGPLDPTLLKGYAKNDFVWGIAKIPN